MASSQTIAEAVENSLNAFNIISQKSLEAVSYDQTVKCKITDITNREFGEYRVTDGTSTFYAYSEKTDYYKGQMVWVTIPQGDYSKQKIIVGKYLESDNSEPYTYVSPLDSFVDMTQNLIEPGMVDTTGLIANGTTLGDTEYKNQITLWSVYGRELKGYDRLAIQASFKSWLKNLNVTSGEYGLKLNIEAIEMGTSQTSNNRSFYTITLNTNDFYGDPYNFETPYSQVKVVDISQIPCIESLSLIFYEKDNFLKSDDTPLEYGVGTASSSLENIWVEKPYISLGYDISKFDTDTVLLTSLNSMTYATYLTEEKKEQIIESLKSGISDPEELHEIEMKIRSGEKFVSYDENGKEIYEDVITPILETLNKKKMTAQWIHFDDDKNVYIYGPNNENDALGDEAVLHWYRYCYEDGINDKLAGNYWYEIEDLKNKYIYSDFNPDIDYPSEKFKVIVEYPSREYLASHVDTSLLAPIPDPDPRSADGATIDLPSKDNNETYYDYLMRILDFLEEKNKEIYDYRYNGSTIDQIEEEIYAEYLQVLADMNLTPEQAAADTTSQLYRKKLMNIKDELDDKTAKISERYNQITNALTDVNYYVSNVLEFTNENEVPNQMTLTLVRGLTLQVDTEGYNGCYKVYDEEGTILSKKESQKKRIVKALWNSVITGVRELDESIEVIEWHIPTENTMIQYPEEGVEYSYYDEFEYTDPIQIAQSSRQLYTKNSNGEYTVAQININNPDTSKKYYIRNSTKNVPQTDDERYFKIQRRAGADFTDHEPGTEEASISEQVFRIKDFYTPTATNNTIECIVWKNNVKYQTSVELIFGPVGTAGTDYTFELEVKDKVPALTYRSEGPASSITLIPHLYNQKGEDEISKYINKLTYGWWSPTTKDLESNSDKVISKELQRDGSLVLTLNINKSLEDARYCVVQATLADVITSSDGKKIKLSAYKPIPIRLSDEYIGIEGADRISYNSRGTDPSFYKNPYQIFKYIDKKTTAITDNDIKWEISYGRDTKRSLSDSDIENFYPILSNENILIPPSIYLRDNGREVAVECYKGSTLIWTQPLYIYQNSYTSALLNSWDGSLTLDEESGIILSTAVGAGAKDNENRYNGVLMGDISGIDQTPTFGMYGYHEGVQSFGFKIDGTAFIGKTNRGQINFDGNSGKISSLSYNIDPENPVGMLIDLDDGYIDMKGANVKAPIVSDQEKSLIAILQEEKEKLEQNKQTLEQEYNNYHEVNDQVEIQKDITNEIAEIDEKITAINEFLNQQDLPDNNNDLYKILQDLHLNYLITDDITYEENHSKVHIGVTDPYFYVTSENGVDLVHVGKDEYFLQTDDYIDEETARQKAIEEADAQSVEQTGEHLSSDERDAIQGYGKGLKINLRGDNDNTGYIKGYNFLLKGVNNGISDDPAIKAMKDSSFELNSSGDPFFRVHYKNTDTNVLAPFVERGLLEAGAPLEKDLMIISRDKFELKSHNYFSNKIDPFDWTWQESYQTNNISANKIGDGVYLDLMKGKLVGHNFSITAIEPDGKLYDTDNTTVVADYTGSYIAINSNGAPYLRIHYQNIPHQDNAGNVNWNEIKDGLYVNRSIDLINISKSAFTISSKDFQRPDGTAIGKGIHFNLNGDKKLSDGSNGDYGSYIEAYSFGLEAYRPGLTTQIPSARIKINSAATGTTTHETITTYIPNYDYLDANPSGTTTAQSIQNYINNCIDPSTGDFKSGLSNSDKETFNSITGNYPNTNKKIARVTTTIGDYPLMIGSLFSVNWDGRTTTGWLKAMGGEIGPYHLTMKALYTNNGLLANHKRFYQDNGDPETEPTPYGVYLGSDGFSVRNSFVIYNMPINRTVGDTLTFSADNQNKHNRDMSDSHALMKPVGYSITYETENGVRKKKIVKTTFEKSYDFVTSGIYNKDKNTGDTLNTLQAKATLEEYFGEGQTEYDQVFVTSQNTKMALGDLSFYLNGNSVLNGKTAINGNTYIFGNLQVGEYKQTLGQNLNNTSNFATLYANTTIYGVFRTTGKSFIGDEKREWSSSSEILRNQGRSSVSEDVLGAIIYRNTYITGYLKVGGSLVIGDIDNEIGVNYHKYVIDETNFKNLICDLTAYTRFSKFYGDVEVAAGFVAGSYRDDPLTDASGKASSYLPKVPYFKFDGDKMEQLDWKLDPEGKHGSGIISKYIYLGRNPTKINSSSNQSEMVIYANTYQYGDFIAGRHGKQILLYANSDKAFLKITDNGVSIQTGVNKPFSVVTNGGDITLDGLGFKTVDTHGNTVYEAGGNITLKGGGNKNLHLIGYNTSGEETDYIKFTNGKLTISAHDSVTIDQSYTSGHTTYPSKFQMSEGTITLQGRSSSITVSRSDGIIINGGSETTGSGTNTQIVYRTLINGNTKVEGNFHVQGTTYLGGNTEISGNAQISGNCNITGNVYAANLNLDSNGVKMSNDSTYSPKASTDGLQFRGTGGGEGATSSLWLGGWTVVGGNLQSSATDPKIKLVPSSATIYFGSDYVDGAGTGLSGSKGIRINSTFVNIAGNTFTIGTGKTSDGETSVKITGSSDYCQISGPTFGNSEGDYSNLPAVMFGDKKIGKLAYANYVKKKITVDLSRTLGTNLSNTKQLYVIANDDGTYYKHGDAVTYYTYKDTGYYYRASFSDEEGDHSCQFVRADSINIKPVYVYRVQKTGETSTSFWWSKTLHAVNDIVKISGVDHAIVALIWSLYSDWSAGYNIYLAYSNPLSVSKPTSLTSVSTYKWASAGSDVHKIESVRIKGSSEVVMEGVEKASDETGTVTLSYTTLTPES